MSFIARITYIAHSFRFINPYPHKGVLEKLRHFYLSTFQNISKDSFLAVDANGIPTRSSESELMSSISQKMEFNSSIAPLLNACIDEILTYMDSRMRLCEYKDDPQPLLCMEMMQWINSLCNQDIHLKETVDDIDKWISFLRTILGEEIFSVDEAHEQTHTISAALERVITLLEKCKPIIAFENDRITISDCFEKIIHRGKNFIVLSFDYIAHIFNTSELPRNFSLVNLQLPYEDLNVESKSALQTDAGKFLRQIACDQSVQALFLHSRTEGSYIEKMSEPKQIDFMSRGSGIITQSTSFKAAAQKEAIDKYIQLHKIFKIIARTLVLIRDANFLAKAGGEILLCNFAKKELEFLIATFSEQVKNLLINTNIISSIAVDFYNIFKNRQKELKSLFPHWKKNYNASGSIKHLIETSVTKLCKTGSKVVSIIDNIEVRKEVAEDRFNRFLQDVKRLKKELSLSEEDDIKPPLRAPPLQKLGEFALKAKELEVADLSPRESEVAKTEQEKQEIYIDTYPEIETAILSGDFSLEIDGINLNYLSPNQRYKDWSMLALGCWKNNIEAVNKLLKHGADPNHAINCLGSYDATPQKNPPPWYERRFGHWGEEGWCWYGHTPLTISILNAAESIVENLLENGAIPNFSFTLSRKIGYDSHLMFVRESWTTLCWIITLINNEKDEDKKVRLGRILKKLLERGADPNHAMPNGWTPLSLAIYHSEEYCTKELLSHGANPNHYLRENLTFIHKFDVSEYQNRRGYTPLFIALEGKNGFKIRLIELLKEYGGITKSYLQSDDSYSGLSSFAFAIRTRATDQILTVCSLLGEFQPDEAMVISETMPVLTHSLSPLPRITKCDGRYFMPKIDAPGKR